MINYYRINNNVRTLKMKIISNGQVTIMEYILHVLRDRRLGVS